MMLHVKAFKWGVKFSADYVHRLAAGLKRHLAMPFRFECITDNVAGLNVPTSPIRDPQLCNGCFARLRLYDPRYQFEMAILPGEKILIIDLDVVIVGPIAALFKRPEPFSILTGINRSGKPYNGGMQLFNAGYRPDIWRDIDAEVPRRFANDEDWLHHKVPGVTGWPAGQDGVYGFLKPGWPPGDNAGENLPADARLVFFVGWRKPAEFAQLPWMQTHWQ